MSITLKQEKTSSCGTCPKDRGIYVFLNSLSHFLTLVTLRLALPHVSSLLYPYPPFPALIFPDSADSPPTYQPKSSETAKLVSENLLVIYMSSTAFLQAVALTARELDGINSSYCKILGIYSNLFGTIR